MGAERAGRYYISVEENIKEYQLINVLQEIFQEFSDWKSRMERLFYSCAGYTQVLNEAEKKFGLVLMLVDKNLRYIASSDSFGRYNAWMRDESIMPMEMINELMEEENESVTRQYYRSMLEGMLKNCCVLQDGEEICCIRNLSETSADKLDVRQDMSVFLRENLCKAGISRSFGDITLLNRYYREAGCALTVGQLTRNTLWYYQFGDLVLPYMWMQAAQELDASQLYHPGICALLEYDRREHTEMVRTVYEYMRHRYNVTETAKTLFIHRTTLLFRLQRIASIAKIDWEDWEERVWIGITLELLRTEGPL